MAKFFDENMNEVEAVPVSEVDAQIAAKQEEWQSQVAAKEEELAAIKDQLSKLENKDLNFSKLRKLADMSEEEKSKMSAENIFLMKQMEALQEEISQGKSSAMESYKENAMALLVKSSEKPDELKAKIEANLDRLKPATNKQELAQNLKDAYALATGGQAPAAPLNPFGMSGFMSPSGGSVAPEPSANQNRKADPQRVSSLAGALGLKIKPVN